MDPTTAEEWQDAVDAAIACLALESARAYGLVAGGPDVDVARCEEMLERGRLLGVEPRPTAIDEFARELAGAATS